MRDDERSHDEASSVSRRRALEALGGVGITATLSGCEAVRPPEAPGQEPRNVIFILSDDHRFDFLSALDEPGTPAFLETPHMNRMLDEGARLSNAFVTTSLCAPSRASILTGQYAHEHGVLTNQPPMAALEGTFPELLQEHGYETAFVGKWHLYHRDTADPRPGFDHWVSFTGQGRYVGQNFNVNGRRVERDGYLTDVLTEYALDWLRQRDDDAPFFLFLSHKAVHRPWRPPPRHRGRYADAPVTRPETFDETKHGPKGKPKWVENQRLGKLGVATRDFERLYRRYCETLLSLDESVGAVLDYLDETGLANSTLTLYMGDNGFLLGEHGLVDKRVAYEPSIRVPLLAYAPGLVEPGTELTDVVANIDVAPTVLDVADVDVPDAMQGRSFRPLLTGEGEDGRENALLYEYFWDSSFPYPPTQFVLRSNRYKYAFSYGRADRNEFYDLERDPRERHNRIDADGYRDRIARFESRLNERLTATGGDEIPIRPDTVLG